MATKEFRASGNREEAIAMLPLVECAWELKKDLGDEKFYTGMKIVRECVREENHDRIAQQLMEAGIHPDKRLLAAITGMKMVFVYQAFRDEFDEAFERR